MVRHPVDKGSKKKLTENRSIEFEEKIAYKPKKCANWINQQFTPHASVGDIERRTTVRNTRQLRKAKVELTPKMVTEAIKANKKSKALGPDRIAPIHMHCISPVAISFFTKLINLSLNSSVIPALWKVGRVIPLPKPCKDPEQAKNYRPIALISPVAKLVEKLILPGF